MITLSEPIVTSSPIATPSCTRTCARRSHERPTTAPSTVVARPIDVEPSMIERAARALAQRHARAEHAVGADGCIGRDPAAVAEERRAFERVEVVEVDALPHPHVAADANAGDLEVHLLVERVEVRLAELIEVPMSCQ